MNVVLRFGNLRSSDRDELEHLLFSIARAYREDQAVAGALNVMLGALDAARTNQAGAPSSVRVRLTADLDPAVEEHVRTHLLAAFQLARDRDWVRDVVRVFFNDVCCDLVDDRRDRIAEAERIRALMHSIPSVQNPHDAI